MSEQLSGKIEIKDPGHLQNTVISLDGSNGDVFIGGPPGGFGYRGRLILNNKDGKSIVFVDGEAQNLTIQSANGSKVVELGRQGDLHLGGGDMSGDIFVKSKEGKTRIRLDGETASLNVGANDQAGRVLVNNTTGNETIRLDGNTGNIELSGEIKIKDWTIAVPDYVFAADYNLCSLDQLANYITEKQHLPGIPSAKEIGQAGINIGAFTMLLLQKIEELSLYLIQQQHQIKEQNRRIQELEQKLSD